MIFNENTPFGSIVLFFDSILLENMVLWQYNNIIKKEVMQRKGEMPYDNHI